MAENDSNAEPGASHPATRRETWLRGAYALLFILLFGVAQTVLNITAVVQFAWQLVRGAPNRHLVTFGRSLAIWLAEVAAFLTAARDEKPFPFASWPDAG